MMNFLLFLLYTMYALSSSSITAMEGFELSTVYKPTTKTTNRFAPYVTCSFKKRSPAPQDQLKIIKELDFQINAEFSNYFPFFNEIKAKWLNDEQSKTIVNILQKNPNADYLTQRSVGHLSKKNCFFKAMINNYTAKAVSDINRVTPQTLESLFSPENNQPSKELNLLPLVIKKYVLDRAKKEIRFSYSAILCKNAPSSMDYCVSKNGHVAATTERYENILIWNLLTFQCSEIVSQGKVTHLFFNANGTHLLVTGTDGTQSYVEEWEMSSLSKTFTVSFPDKGLEIHAAYLDNTGSRAFIVSHHECNNSMYLSQYGQTFFTIDKNNVPKNRGTIESQDGDGAVINGFHYQHPTAEPLYRIRFSQINEEIRLTKLECYYLFLCKNAVKAATNTEDILIIFGSSAYKELTPYEKTMIKEAIKEKKEELKIASGETKVIKHLSLI